MADSERLAGYERYLRRKGYAAGTIRSYLRAANHFLNNHAEASENSLLEYRDWLVASFKPATADQRIRAINCYLGYLGLDDLKLAGTHIRQKSFRECAIDFAAYRRLLRHLRDGGYERDYHAVRMLTTTGARISELLGMEVRHMRDGYADVVNKARERRIHIPDVVANDALRWAEGEGRHDGPLFLNQYGDPISQRGISHQLKVRASECNVDERLVYPHAFRRLFAICFLEAGGDIAFLADLLGHASIQTTAVYLRRTRQDQHDEVNRIVCW